MFILIFCELQMKITMVSIKNDELKQPTPRKDDNGHYGTSSLKNLSHKKESNLTLFLSFLKLSFLLLCSVSNQCTYTMIGKYF